MPGLHGRRRRASLVPEDAASLALYERNHGPWCEAPATQGDPFCSAVPFFPARKSDAYPEKLAQDGAMCDELGSRPDGKDLLNPFTVVRERNGKLAAVPLVEAYGPRMALVAAELRAAADAQGSGEAALRSYLLAAAAGFETGDWEEADDAWSRMNGRNSKWYLRVAPDEVEFDPCREKAGEMLDAPALMSYSSAKDAGLIGTILHEATHNLGPHSDSKIKGKTAAEIFGGRLEGVLEELKAQTGALWYIEMLRRKEQRLRKYPKESYSYTALY